MSINCLKNKAGIGIAVRRLAETRRRPRASADTPTFSGETPCPNPGDAEKSSLRISGRWLRKVLETRIQIRPGVFRAYNRAHDTSTNAHSGSRQTLAAHPAMAGSGAMRVREPRDAFAKKERNPCAACISSHAAPPPPSRRYAPIHLRQSLRDRGRQLTGASCLPRLRSRRGRWRATSSSRDGGGSLNSGTLTQRAPQAPPHNLTQSQAPSSPPSAPRRRACIRTPALDKRPQTA